MSGLFLTLRTVLRTGRSESSKQCVLSVRHIENRANRSKEEGNVSGLFSTLRTVQSLSMVAGELFDLCILRTGG